MTISVPMILMDKAVKPSASEVSSVSPKRCRLEFEAAPGFGFSVNNRVVLDNVFDDDSLARGRTYILDVTIREAKLIPTEKTVGG